MTSKTILVVDDEPPVRAALRAVLEAEGWQVREAADAAGMLQEIEAGGIDLVTLDLGLGEEDGLDVAKELRARSNVPVVVITGHGEPFDRAKGLESGADDYIVKPFDNREVAIRLGRILDRYGSSGATPQMLSFDHSEVDLTRGIVSRQDGSNEALTGIETKLLSLFLSRPAQVLTRDEINQALHGRDWSPYDRTIDGHVARLRRKIEPLGEAPTMIRSVRGVGYVFTGEVTEKAVGS